MDNIVLSQSKFGDRFETRSGELAIFMREIGFVIRDNTYRYYVALGGAEHLYTEDGHYLSGYNNEHDLIKKID